MKVDYHIESWETDDISQTYCLWLNVASHNMFVINSNNGLLPRQPHEITRTSAK